MKLYKGEPSKDKEKEKEKEQLVCFDYKKPGYFKVDYPFLRNHPRYLRRKQ